MSKYLDEYSMRQTSIFELRNIARDMGVLSPTIYKKEDLIKKLLKIISGEEKPQMPKTRQGRPPKKTLSSQNFNNAISGENLVSFKNCLLEENENNVANLKYDFKSPITGGYSVLASPEFVYGDEGVFKDDNLNTKTEIGYFHLVQNKYGYIFEVGRTKNVENVICVPENFIAEFNLKSGDLVECVSKEVVSTKTKYVLNIKSVNGYSNKNKNRKTFEQMEIDFNFKNQDVFLDNSLPISNSKLGTRNIILTPTLKTFNLLTNKINNNKNFCVVSLILDALPEDIAQISFENENETFYTILGDSEKQNNITVNLAIGRVKRLAEENKNVVLLVNDIKKMIKYQNFLYDYGFEDLKNKSLDTTYSLLSLARNLKQGNSITIYALLKTAKNNLFDNIIINELDNMNCNFYNM